MLRPQKLRELKNLGKCIISALVGGIAFVMLRLVTMLEHINFKHIDMSLMAAWFLYGVAVGITVYMIYSSYVIKRQTRKWL